MGLFDHISDFITDVVGSAARQYERNAYTAHRAAQSGMYNGRKLSEQGREKMRLAEIKFRNDAERNKNLYERRKANKGK